MLVLSRKLNEEILIGDNIKITIVEISKNKVRVGIAAPKEITVLRKEIANSEKAAEATDNLPANNSGK